MQITYLREPTTPPHNREFESALAAFRCGDPNPLRLYLDLPLKHECEDCGGEHELIGHTNSLVCKDCAEHRNRELEQFLDRVESKTWLVTP